MPRVWPSLFTGVKVPSNTFGDRRTVAAENDSQRAVLCALGMQRAMAAVNERNLSRGWPAIEMGIAVHTGEVVVGNIGSTKRSKYGVVGRTINTTARIESFTVGGQIIISPTSIARAGQGLILGDEVEVHAKGMKEPLRCRQLLGHEGYPELALGTEAACTMLAEPLPVRCCILSGKHFNEHLEPATIIGLSRRQAVLETRNPLPVYSNLLLRLPAAPDDAEAPELYAKVVRAVETSANRCLIHFTSVPPAVRTRLNQLADPAINSTKTQ